MISHDLRSSNFRRWSTQGRTKEESSKTVEGTATRSSAMNRLSSQSFVIAARFARSIDPFVRPVGEGSNLLPFVLTESVATTRRRSTSRNELQAIVGANRRNRRAVRKLQLDVGERRLPATWLSTWLSSPLLGPPFFRSDSDAFNSSVRPTCDTDLRSRSASFYVSSPASLFFVCHRDQRRVERLTTENDRYRSFPSDRR